MASDAARPLLALKVMRVSRPSLASAWEPFYSSSPAFSARSTASPLSLQGAAPLDGHPKTLRDLSSTSEVLLLPASFGAIQLGETFSAALALTNEASTALSDVVLSIDVQTVTAKVALATFGPADGVPGATLLPASTLECAVAHEVKELGQHVLACAVSYRAPPGERPPAAPEPGADPAIHTFRKFYKFAVTNPLSVKTKTHVPRAPSAMLSAIERSKVFLEVHLASGAPGPLAFERVKLLPAPGWTCAAPDAPEPAIAGLVHPQDVRQAVFTLLPGTSDAGLERTRAEKIPGSIIPLGQLDIAWRSAFGEPGHLVTSMLTRRVPAPPPAPQLQPPPVPPKLTIPAAAASALPPHLQQRPSVSSPSSPIGPSRALSPGPPSRPGSPAIRSAFAVPLSSIPVPPEPQISCDLLASAPSTARLDRPFAATFTLLLSSSSLPPRTLHLAVQRAQVPATPALPLTRLAAEASEPFTPRLPSGLSTPTTATQVAAPAPRTLAARLLVASPRSGAPPVSSGVGGKRLPAPDVAGLESRGAVPLGASAVFLEPIVLTGEMRAQGRAGVALEYMPVQRGLARLGAIEVFLLEDAEEARSVGRWDSAGEVWVEG